MKTWYTYHIIDPETNRVFYIGKGHGQRAYIHMTRALKWRETGKIVPGGNRHLYHKLLKIHDKGLNPLYSMVLETQIEKEALDREELDIRSFGLENLCNLTYGGEGETKTPETLEKMSKSMHAFWDSGDGYALRKKYSENRMGDNNPMHGYTMTEDQKKFHVEALLSVPRWNKGLKGDPRSKGHHRGELSPNAMACRLINEDGRVFEARSMTELSKLSGVPLVTVNRLRHGTYKTNKKGWRFELI